jgi:tetratricopeptide (TPR) repeat protein
VYTKQKYYGAAIEQLQPLLEKQPDDWESRNSLAAIYMILYLRRPEQDRVRQSALEQWHKSLETNPFQPTIRNQVKRWATPVKPPAPAKPAKAAKPKAKPKPPTPTG